MQLKFDFLDYYAAEIAEPHEKAVCPACEQKIKLLEQELAKVHAYLRILGAKRQPKG